MKKEWIKYLIVTILFIIISIIILSKTNLTNNIAISKSIQIILILLLIRISYGCAIYIRNQYKKNKYSYSIILNVGLLLFININILRMIDLLIENWNVLSIKDIFNNSIESFSFFAMLTLPCITILSIYSIITNIILVKKEGLRYQNLLGIILGILSIIGLFGTQTIYYITKSILNNEYIIIKKLIDVSINITLSYFYTLIIATLYCNVMASKHTPDYDKDYIIILGCKINNDGTLTPLLRARVDKAIEFAKEQKEKTGKDIVFVPSGGQGKDEITSEAEAMKNYLISQGIKKKNILIENKSTSTIENMKYSNSIIIKENEEAKISFSTTNYHVFRSGVIANKCGIDCDGMGSKTKWYYYTNALIREFIANIVQEKNKHITLLLLMNITTIILLLIGYINQLIKI